MEEAGDERHPKEGNVEEADGENTQLLAAPDDVHGPPRAASEDAIEIHD